MPSWADNTLAGCLKVHRSTAISQWPCSGRSRTWLWSTSFRDGNVPAGKDNLRLICRAFHALPEWVTERYVRSDSACYDDAVLKWLAHPQRQGGPLGHIGFTISADMSQQLLCDPPARYWPSGTAGGARLSARYWPSEAGRARLSARYWPSEAGGTRLTEATS